LNCSKNARILLLLGSSPTLKTHETGPLQPMLVWC
jgi:hypothetical protein